ncbi:uncharacterized protein ACA1_069450 [Acanthamoeba castellanii str. Neff]|uniref:Frizzled/Smoothened 7TM domain-containing protein n=1 Tax=Acanthamoeba castellanii (strain ATCC 30010 / Neff) TaxID=1257118 RepID=L8HFY5_ACACF|nr:uncharacterized protein ACA1_069450 [Acanthamoeba castellanii str. Neff]ELR23361.1 hypothetical protein ACA1_069450 [Acanthamoeba castellanii str. Neff]
MGSHRSMNRRQAAALRLSCLGSFVSCRLAQMPNCSAVDPATMMPLFPTTNCNNASQDVVVPYSQADCPYPLQFNERGTVADGSLSLSADEQICVYPCPAPMFTPSDWHASAGITISLAILSTAMMLFLVITYILSPRKRRFPTSFQLWVCVSSLISSIGIDIAVVVGGPERTNCTWDDTPVLQTFAGARDNDGQGVVCILQGMLIMFGGLAGSFWWVMLAYTVFQFLVFELASDRARRAQFEARAAGHNCFVVSPWDWGLFYAPICLNLAIGTTLMVISIIKVLRVRFHIKEQVLRLVILIAVYWLIFVYLIFYRVYIEVVLDDVKAAIGDQIVCSAVTGQECSTEKEINKGAWYLQALTLSGQGVIIFCCLGMSKDTFTFWQRLLRNWRDPMSVILHDTNKNGRSGSISSRHAGRPRSSSFSMPDPAEGAARTQRSIETSEELDAL